MEERFSFVKAEGVALSADDRLLLDNENRAFSVLGGSGGGAEVFGEKDGLLGLDNDVEDALMIFPFNAFAN